MLYITKKQHRGRYTDVSLNAIDYHFPATVQKLAPETATETSPLDGSSYTTDELPFDFKWDLNLTNNILKVKFINVTEDNRIINNFSIDMAHFSDAEACTLWYIKDEEVLKNVNTAGDADEQIISKQNLVNSLALTLPAKQFTIFGNQSLIVFWSTKDNPTAEDIIVGIIRPIVSTDPDYDSILPEMQLTGMLPKPQGDHTVTVTGNLTKHPDDPVVMLVKDYLIPEITVTSSTVSGDIVTVNFTTDSKMNNIYLVQSQGYLPKLKIPVTNGAGSFKVVTTGMDTGDVVKVKLGFKYWTNATEFTKVL
jgi:hypothetical protein